MRILYVVPYAPSPVRVRPYQFIRTLARNGHELVLATLYSGELELANLRDLGDTIDRIHEFNLTPWRKAWNLSRALPSSVPLQAAYSWHPNLAGRVSELIRGDDFDVIHVEHIRGGQYALLAKQVLRRKGWTTPVVWDSVDCISELFRLASIRSRSFFGRWVTRFDLPRTRRYESRLVRAFDSTLVTSPVDREALLGLGSSADPPAPIEVIPNGVDLEYFDVNSTMRRRQDRIVMTGKMSYHANVTMVLDFVEKTFPLIKRARPHVTLTIVGKDPSPELRVLAKDKSIEVTGTVPDIRPYLWQATLAVAPLTYSVGIQNKVLEALATATPVVVSPLVARSIRLRHGRNAFIADDPESFSASVIQLLDNPGMREELGRNGRRLVEQDHGWSKIALRLEEVYGGLIRAHR